jgi:hypothetical protein
MAAGVIDTVEGRWFALRDKQAEAERGLAVAESREADLRAKLAEAVAEVRRAGFSTIEELEAEIARQETELLAAVAQAEEALA